LVGASSGFWLALKLLPERTWGNGQRLDSIRH
jgi:hypothetical protein